MTGYAALGIAADGHWHKARWDRPQRAVCGETLLASGPMQYKELSNLLGLSWENLRWDELQPHFCSGDCLSGSNGRTRAPWWSWWGWDRKPWDGIGFWRLRWEKWAQRYLGIDRDADRFLWIRIPYRVDPKTRETRVAWQQFFKKPRTEKVEV